MDFFVVVTGLVDSSFFLRCQIVKYFQNFPRCFSIKRTADGFFHELGHIVKK